MTKYRMTRCFWRGFIVLAVCVGLASDLGAFSVGEIDVQSAVNEPFRAEVIFALEAHERDREFEVQLGTPQDYQLEELERPPILQHMHVILAPDKRDTVRIFSNVPITEEAFDLLVLLRSGKLTIVRNYHIRLLESVPAAQQRAVVEPVTRQAASEPVTSPQPTGPSTPPADPPEPDLPPILSGVQRQLAPPDSYGPIQRGERMYDIVGKLDVPRDQRWQAVVLLWRVNHEVFLRGNLHGLLVGAHLDIPADYADRLSAMDREASQRIIASQWQAWRRREVTTAAQALAMTMDLAAGEQEPATTSDEGPADEPLPQPPATPEVADTDTLPEDDGPMAVATQEPAAATEDTEAVPAPEEPVVDDGTSDTALVQPAMETPEGETALPPEGPVPDDTTAAVAPPQVVRLPTDEGSSFVSTQELKLLLGNLEDRLLRRLAPVQESQGTAPFVSPTELQVSLEDLENRLTQRVEQMVAQGGPQLAQEPVTRPNPAPVPPAGLEFIAALPMPPVAYLLVLINVILLLFSLALGWRWWRQNARGGT